MSVLTGKEIVELGLVTKTPRVDQEQIQPNGVDLTVAHVERFTGAGGVWRQGKLLATSREIQPEGVEGTWILPPGAYLVTFAEAVDIPNNMMAYLHPRSTLLRCGVTLETAVWDAGYRGRGQSLLVVHNPHGFALQPYARIAQMTFHRLTKRVDEGYHGSYQGEHLTSEVMA